VIGQNYDRPANERRRRLHPGTNHVSQRARKFLTVVVWSAGIDQRTDETFSLRLVLPQRKRVVKMTRAFWSGLVSPLANTNETHLLTDCHLASQPRPLLNVPEAEA